MRWLLLLPFLFCGCGYAEVACDYEITVSGLQFCSEVPVESQAEHIENIVRFVEEEVQAYYPEVTGIEQTFEDVGVVVHVINEGSLATGCQEIDHNIYRCENHAAGVASEHNRAIYIKGYDSPGWCIGFGALGHELLHIIEYTYFGSTLGDHDREHFFVDYLDPVEVIQATIEYKAERRAVEMCLNAD